MSKEETVQIYISSPKNISFNYTLDTGITRSDWASMTDREKEEVAHDCVLEVVEWGWDE